MHTSRRAYTDGTINWKFQHEHVRKQLMFVIDISGSMGVNVGPHKTALDVAIDNTVEIIRSHVQVDDIFGTMLFDNIIDFPIPLQ